MISKSLDFNGVIALTPTLSDWVSGCSMARLWVTATHVRLSPRPTHMQPIPP